MPLALLINLNYFKDDIVDITAICDKML